MNDQPFSFTTAPWSRPREVNTGAGLRALRKLTLSGPSNDNWWKVWRADKFKVKDLRFSAGRDKETNAWEACHWQESPGQFDDDVAALDALLRGEEVAEERAKVEQEVDFVPESYPELRTAQAGKLYDWQRPSCQRVVAALSTGNALDASQTGAGKTIVALAACAELGLTPYVVAPLAVLEAWRRAAAFMGVRLGGLVNYDKGRAGSCEFIRKGEEARDDKGRVIKDVPIFEFRPPQRRGDLFEDVAARSLLIFDEVQKTKAGMESLQGRMLIDTVKNGAKVLMLSATAAKDPMEMFGLGLALGLHKGGEDYYRWLGQHACKRGTYGWKFTAKPEIAADAMKRIHRKLFPHRGTRVRSADVPGYPDNHVSAHLIENKDIEKAYDKMEDELELIAEKAASGKLDKADKAAADFAALMKARRESEHGKLDWMIEETQEMVADGFQVVVFLNFREHLAIMRREMKLTSAPVWGTEWLRKDLVLDPKTGLPRFKDIDGRPQSPAERQAIIDRFQQGKDRVILVSLQAGGAGVNLHDENGIAPRQSLISPNFSVVDLVQAAGRIWRASSKTKATQRIVFAARTLEEEIAVNIQAKCHSLEILNDGDLMPDSMARVLENPALDSKLAA